MIEDDRNKLYQIRIQCQDFDLGNVTWTLDEGVKEEKGSVLKYNYETNTVSLEFESYEHMMK